MEDWISLLSAILSASAIITAVVLNWWQNKKTNERLQESFKNANERLQKSLNYEIRLRNKRVHKLYTIIKEIFDDIKDKGITERKNGTFSIELEDITQLYYKKSMFYYFKDDLKYIFIDEDDKDAMEDFNYKTRSRSLLCSFYGSVEIWLNRITCKKNLFDFKKEIKDIRITDIIPRLLDKIKKDCKKYYGIDLK